MAKRVLLSGVLAALAGLGATGVQAADTSQQSGTPMILDLLNRQIEPQDKAFNESVKRDAAQPKPSAIDDWEPQADGSMRNKRTGVSITVRNPCPPGDLEHDAALAAYNRAGRPRR